MEEKVYDQSLVGLGGWFGLFLINWVTTSALSLFILPGLLAGIPSNFSYSPPFAIAQVFSVTYVLFLLASTICAFMKRRITIRLYVAAALCIVLSNIICELLFQSVGDTSHMSTFVRVLLTEAVTILYLRQSVRVKNTLVK